MLPIPEQYLIHLSHVFLLFRYNYTMNNQYYKIGELHKALIEAGIPHSKSWIRRQELKGNLKLPRSTTDFKKSQGSRKLAAVRMLTDSQIKEIVQAFLPGGKGYWSYE